jgi:hypothetical protein
VNTGTIVACANTLICLLNISYTENYNEFLSSEGIRMTEKSSDNLYADIQKHYPEKCIALEKIFKHIHRGNHIFISTACGKPQYLVKELIRFVDENPKALVDTEILHLWSLGVAPFAEEKFKSNFRLNTFLSATTRAMRSTRAWRIIRRFFSHRCLPFSIRDWSVWMLR